MKVQIKGEPYEVVAEPNYGGYWVRKLEGDSEYYVTPSPSGGVPGCTCPDFQYRRKGLSPCKHGTAILDLGIPV